MGEGKGAPGKRRAKSVRGVRRFQLSVKFDEVLAAKIKRTATERGQTLGQVIRDLIEDGYRHRRGAGELLSDERRAQLRELSRPGNARQRAPGRLRPVIPGGGRFDR